MTTIQADELQPGDVLVYDGHHRRITRVDRRDGWAWPIAGFAADDDDDAKQTRGGASHWTTHLIHVHRSAA